ncbi:MAG: membrane protein insertion efficiency factor YidD [Patescibacteria group bacterium]|nr:membrane protein insertion efficiency factor YidD [Patescibacteria group bacterium]
MKKVIIFLINLYQKIPLRSHSSCVFIPTCSQYTKEALIKYGLFKGLFLGFKRVIKCQPWQKNKYDPL